MRRDASILPGSSRIRKMFRAGGHVPVHTVAPASASALAMAKPYPPSSATPATRARLPRRSMLSICPPRTRKSEHGTRNSPPAIRSAFRVSRSVLDEESRRHRDQLRMPDQRMREYAAQRAFLRRDRIHGAGERVEERVAHLFQGALDAVVPEMVVAQELHPGGVIGAQPRGARVAGADGRR